jgi:hypothetical protein
MKRESEEEYFVHEDRFRKYLGGVVDSYQEIGVNL